MKILAVSDVESRRYYDFGSREKLREFDLILSCGDLKREYLEFLVTMARCPLLYVRGNHDDGFQNAPPEGCQCIEDRLVVYQGLRILGLGGSMQYRTGENLYTDRQMNRRVRRLRWQLRRAGGFDILLTHAPAAGLNDLEDLPHQGFTVFRTLLEQYQPGLFIHGHVHRNYGFQIPQRCVFGATTVINAFEYCVVDYGEL